MSNIKKKFAEINRRNFLTGSLNTLLVLPVLDFILNLSGTAIAENGQLPKRFLMLTNDWKRSKRHPLSFSVQF